MDKKLLEQENKEKDQLIDEYSEMVDELSKENEIQKEEIMNCKIKIEELEKILKQYQSKKDEMIKQFQVNKRSK